MAARLNRKHSEDIRQKIQSSVIVDRFHKHFMGDLDLTMTQIKVGESLLDRSVPKLSHIQHTGPDDGAIQITEVPWLPQRGR